LIFLDPPFRDAVERSRIEVVEFAAAMPKGDDQAGPAQQIEMFAHGLTGHMQVAAELAQGLPVTEMKLVEKLSPAGISQGFEDIVQGVSIMQPKGCISSYSPGELAETLGRTRPSDRRVDLPLDRRCFYFFK